MRLFGVCAAAVGLAAVTGCGNKHRTYPVEGKVVWNDDAPAVDLAGGVVTFDSAALVVSARGVIRPDGTFVLGTYGPTDGVPAGEYKVSVNRPPEADAGGPVPPLPSRYESVARSGLTATVEEKANAVTVKVERSKKKPAANAVVPD